MMIVESVLGVGKTYCFPKTTNFSMNAVMSDVLMWSISTQIQPPKKYLQEDLRWMEKNSLVS